MLKNQSNYIVIYCETGENPVLKKLKQTEGKINELPSSQTILRARGLPLSWRQLWSTGGRGRMGRRGKDLPPTAHPQRENVKEDQGESFFFIPCLQTLSVSMLPICLSQFHKRRIIFQPRFRKRKVFRVKGRISYNLLEA